MSGTFRTSAVRGGVWDAKALWPFEIICLVIRVFVVLSDSSFMFIIVKMKNGIGTISEIEIYHCFVHLM